MTKDAPFNSKFQLTVCKYTLTGSKSLKTKIHRAN